MISALVWLGVGVLSLWFTWIAIREIQPFFESLNQTASQLRPPSAPARGTQPGASTFTPADVQRLQQFLPLVQPPSSGTPSQ